MEMTRRDLVGTLAAAGALRQREGSRPLRAPLPRVQSDADVEALLTHISNWGRWGPDDRRGTVNFLTPAHRVRAARGVRSGRMVALARQTSLRSEGVREGRHEVQSGDGASRDVVGFVPHGFALTHLDALCHASADAGRLYNGVPASVVTAAGVQALDANAMGDGICGRGVLLDIGRAHGGVGGAHGGALEPGTPIRVADLEGAERVARVTVSEGDVLLVRTGAGPRNTRERRSGLHPECLPWLHARRIALLGGDGDNDAHPLDGFDRWASAMHSVGIPYLGLPLLDNLELDALGRACAEERRWTFLVTVAPWRLTGTTSSLVNPLAIF
jgi:kynurenine formamidase